MHFAKHTKCIMLKHALASMLRMHRDGHYEEVWEGEVG